MSSPQRPALAELASPEVLPDPYPVLARLREASPFAEFDGALVVVGRLEDCSRVLRDPRASSVRSSSLLARPGPARQAPSFLSLDPPDHTRLRRLVSRAFTPRVIARLEPRIRDLADELLGAGGGSGDGGGGELDVVSELAYPLPVRIISELLGVPVADHPRFAGWSARLAHSLQPPLGLSQAEATSEIEAAGQARAEFADYFRELIARRRQRPADDLLSDLIRAEEDGQRLSERELIGTCVLLLVAGHETTVSLISNAVLALLRHPEQLAALRADPSLAAGAVEETLRYDAPVQLTSRVARGGMQVGSVSAPDGAVILLLLAAAGRDAAAFPDPDRFDIRRGAAGRAGPAVGSSASGLGASSAGAGPSGSGAGASSAGAGPSGSGAGHLAFAAGPHFCLGAPLARLEATIALQAFAARVTDPELVASSLAYRPNLNLRGPQRLVVAHGGIRPAAQSR